MSVALQDVLVSCRQYVYYIKIHRMDIVDIASVGTAQPYKQ